MDLSFSARSQTVTLVSSFHSLAKTHRIRRQFLSSSRNCVLPFPLRSRCRKLGLNKSRRLVIAASMESDAVVVVVAVTVISVFSIAYFNHYLNSSGKKKKKHADSEEYESLGFPLSELGAIIVDQVIGKWFGDVASTEAPGKGLVWKFEGNGMELLIQATTSVHNDTVAVGSVQSSASADWSSVALRESEDVCLSSAGLGMLEPGPVLPLMFATELFELGLVQETKSDSLVDETMFKVKSGTAAVSIGCVTDEKVGFSGYFGSLREIVREDLYSFCGGNPLVATSPLDVNDIGVTSRFSPLNRKSFSSLKVKTKLKGAEQLAHDSLKMAEHVERKGTLARHDGGLFHQRKRSGQSKGSPDHKDKNHPIKDNQTRLLQHPNLNSAHSDSNDRVPSLFSAYNHLLQNGRLSECIDLLEHMEQRGLLDMNKVYHAKFFKICKSQNAVEEAFRFFKLVPNPTLSTFNMLMSACASSQDHEGAFQVLQLAQEKGLKADCKLYTTLISTCAKCGKVDAMFEVFHEMVNAGVEPNVHTYGALIDGCARVGQVAKAFGAYGIMRSKNVKPDRVVFNALITACGKSGAVDRAFDVLSEMSAETGPIEPDHITVGALMKACAKAGQVHRAQEVYRMIHKYKITGTPEVYTIAVNCCSLTGDWEFASRVYDDMIQNEVLPDEMFLSALIDVAGHAGKVDTAFEILQKARAQGIKLGIMTFSSLMGACSNSKNWQKALELYEEMKSIKLGPTVSTINALITALCDGDQLSKAIAILSEMRSFGLCPNTITYSILLVSSERLNDIEVGLMLLSQAKNDSISPNLVMCKCIIGMCLRRFEKAFSLGEPIVSFDTGRPQIQNEWTSIALMVYRETIAAGQMPTMEVVSQVLRCLQLPCDASLKSRLVEDLGISSHPSSSSNLCSLVDGFGEYDARAFSLLEEAASLGIVPCVSFKESPIVVDAKELQIHIAVVYLLTILRGLKHRLAAGARLPNVTILLPVEQAKVTTSKGEKTINLAGRVGQAVASLLRRLGVRYQGSESYGKIRINGISLRRWLQPKLASPLSRKPEEFGLSLTRIRKGIFNQQRSIRTGNFSLE